MIRISAVPVRGFVTAKVCLSREQRSFEVGDAGEIDEHIQPILKNIRADIEMLKVYEGHSVGQLLQIWVRTGHAGRWVKFIPEKRG